MEQCWAKPTLGLWLLRPIPISTHLFPNPRQFPFETREWIDREQKPKSTTGMRNSLHQIVNHCGHAVHKGLLHQSGPFVVKDPSSGMPIRVDDLNLILGTGRRESR